MRLRMFGTARKRHHPREQKHRRPRIEKAKAARLIGPWPTCMLSEAVSQRLIAVPPPKLLLRSAFDRAVEHAAAAVHGTNR